MSQKEFCERTRISPRHLIYLCEKRVVLPAEETRGRGRPRRFSKENVAEYRMAEALLNLGFELRRVASIVSFVQEFFGRLHSHTNPPKDIPFSLACASGRKPAWLILLDQGIVTLRFRVGRKIHHADYVKMVPGGRIIGMFPWEDVVYESAVARLEIDLVKLSP